MRDYDPDVVYAVIQNLGYEDSDGAERRQEYEAMLDDMRPFEIWRRYLTWNGILGYADELHRAHESIFKQETP